MKKGPQKSLLNKSENHTDYFTKPSGQPAPARLEGQHPNAPSVPRARVAQG